MRYFLFVSFSFVFQISTAQNWDIDQLRKINSNASTGKTSFWNNYEKTVTPVTLGTPATLWIIALAKKDKSSKAIALSATGAFILNGGATVILKKIINRDRPFITYPDLIKRANTSSTSMPSGHTSASFATATTLTLSYPKWYVVLPAYLYAGGMGYTRMYQGVHYPSDVFFGAILGTGSAWISHKLTKRFLK